MMWWRRKIVWLLAFVCLMGIALLVCVIRTSPKLYDTPTSGMSPTIQKGDKILCVRPWKPVSQLARGTVVTYDAAEASPKLSGTYAKRLVALPGDRVEVVNGVLAINGVPLPHREAAQPKPTKAIHAAHGMIASPYPLVVPSGRVFVLGDNYSNSLDSRFHGPIPQTAIERIALWRIAPFSRMGKIE